MAEVSFEIPDALRRGLAETIGTSGGNEVYFLGRVSWNEAGTRATLDEVDVLARGNRGSTPAIIEGAENWDIAIHNHPGGDLTPSEADLNIAAELGNRRVGFAIIDNTANRSYVVVPPLRREQVQRVDPDEVERVFAPGGPLERALAGGSGGGSAYELRPGQVAMAMEVARAINENAVVALEAGTGIGKSFAYLVPCILWAVRNKKRVVVSTNTINLQEQLVSKDLPALEEALDEKFRYALIKGRSNYACRRKAAEARSEPASLFDDADSQRMLGDVLTWVEGTAEGSLADLGMTPPPDVWERVMSETDKSLNVNCSFYQSCFFYNAKREAFKADVLVVNHHLFFADLAVRRETGNYQWNLILPGYDRVVFDEAQHLEDIASRHLGVRFTQQGIARRFSRLVSKQDPRCGILPNLARKLRSEGALLPAERLENEVIHIVPELAAKVDEEFESLAHMARCFLPEEDSNREADSLSPRGTTHQIRLTPSPRLAVLRGAVVDKLGKVRRELQTLGRFNERAVRALKAAAIDGERKKSLLLELTSLSVRLDRLVESLDFFADTTDESQVRWLELRVFGRARDARRRTIGFATSPIRVADVLNKCLYEPLKTVVMTSATLSVAGKPDFFSSRVGLDQIEAGRFNFHDYPSPFDYPRQALLLVPQGFPDPREASYERACSRSILEILRRMKGRTFVLFTAYGMLQRVYESLEKDLVAMGLRPLRQGFSDRSELLRRFRSGPNNVLFGTDSFWEGVDVRGRQLECVIITRLPFRVPTEPVQLSRLEDLERRGIASFPHYSVPQAVLKLKQGFGRLIRSDTDRGVVVILDRRVVTKAYGKTFLDSLPPARRVIAPVSDLLVELERFFGAGGSDSPGKEPPQLAAEEGNKMSTST